MKTGVFLIIVFFTLVLFSNYSGAKAKSDYNHPNIVFILADDLGYGDVSCLNENGKIQTPNIDRMAEAGVTFTDAHSSSAVCTPTRYGILTGRYNWRSRLKQGVLGIYGKPLMDPARTNIASMLKKQGYQTACIGKWHLGRNWPTTDDMPPVNKPGENNIDFTKPVTGGPEDVGFDYYFGTDVPNYPPYCFIENRYTVGIPSVFYTKHPYGDCRPGIGIPNWKMENILPTLQQKAVDYILEASEKGQPFFLYFPLTAPHTPIAPSEKFKGKSGLNPYADFVMEVDDVVGQVLSTLKKAGVYENTLVVFTSDNGCSPQADFSFLTEHGHNPSYIFRGNKADLFEGGHRIPCLVQWPAQIKDSQTINQTVCLNDFMATIAEITRYSPEDNEAEDSYSLWPVIDDSDSKDIIREATVHHSINGSFTIRKGDWKLLMAAGSGGWSYPRPGKDTIGLPHVQLYNIKNDPSEKMNMQEKHPEIVKELSGILKKYIVEGRSTPGTPQKNDGKYPWRQIMKMVKE